MQTPKSISFQDLEVDVSRLNSPYENKGPMNPSWTRVKFTLPDPYEAPNKVIDWLTANCGGDWKTYHYQDPKSKSQERIMVVRFYDKNDALFFKLRGGHQSWESSDNQ